MKMIRPIPITPEHVVSTTVVDELIAPWQSGGPPVVSMSRFGPRKIVFNPAVPLLAMLPRTGAPIIHIVDTQDNVLLPTLSLSSGIADFDFSPAGDKWVLAAPGVGDSGYPGLVVMSVADRSVLWSKTSVVGWQHCAWAGTRIVAVRRGSYSDPKDFQVYNGVTGALQYSYAGAYLGIRAVSADGQYACLAATAETLEIHDITTGAAALMRVLGSDAGYRMIYQGAAFAGSGLYFYRYTTRTDGTFDTASIDRSGVFYLAAPYTGTPVRVIDWVAGAGSNGHITASRSGSLLAIAGGTSSHVYDIGTDAFKPGTTRADFDMRTLSPIAWSHDDAHIAVAPRLLEEHGAYQLRRTTDYALVPRVAVEYLVGDRVIFDGMIYEALVDHPPLSPTAGLAADPPQWLRVGATNSRRCFDQKTGSQTTAFELLEYEIVPGLAFTGIALLNVAAAQARVVVTDPVEGVVYDTGMRDLYDNAHVVDWHEFFFSEYVSLSEIVFTDLPHYPDASVTISLYSPAAEAACGEIVIGRVATLGGVKYGTSVGIIDYSVKETDAFGNFSVLKRDYSKRAEFDVAVRTPQVAATHSILARYRADPVVWVGADDRPETIIYGYYRDFGVTLSTPAWSDCSITVEGI